MEKVVQESKLLQQEAEQNSKRRNLCHMSRCETVERKFDKMSKKKSATSCGTSMRRFVLETPKHFTNTASPAHI
ncbi:unnamed protein product [Brassica oleracea]